jgi:hypothetical protein
MKHALIVFGLICLSPMARAGGSIGWDDVRVRISKTDPELIKIIDTTFDVNKSGGGVRLGNQFGKRVGERIPPYDFDAIRKSTGERYHLKINQSDDYDFTGRYQFTWQIITKK